MMGWNYGYTGMMSGGFWFFGSLLWIVIFVDFILLGLWLWKQLKKK